MSVVFFLLKLFFLFGIFFIPSWLAYKMTVLFRGRFQMPTLIAIGMFTVLSAILYYTWWHAGYFVSRIDATNADEGTEYGFGIPLFFLSYIFGAIYCAFRLKRVNLT